MTEIATYVLGAVAVAIPAIAFIPELQEALFALFRMSSAMIGTPWP